MDSQLYAALIALGILVVTSVGAIVKALTDRVLRDLERNTKITREASDASKDRLNKTLDRLATERNRVLALRELLRERDDRLAYLQARLPGIDRALAEYGRRREDRRTGTEENEVLERLLSNIDAHQSPDSK